MTKFLDMRRDVQEIFRGTPHDKQVMMFSATLSKETREICKKFMQTVWPILHLFVVTAKTIIEGMVEATHQGFNTTMVEANLEGVAMLEVTLKAVAEVVVEAVAEAEVKDMLDRFGSEMNPFH